MSKINILNCKMYIIISASHWTNTCLYVAIIKYFFLWISYLNHKIVCRNKNPYLQMFNGWNIINFFTYVFYDNLILVSLHIDIQWPVAVLRGLKMECRVTATKFKCYRFFATEQCFQFKSTHNAVCVIESWRKFPIVGISTYWCLMYFANSHECYK